MEQGLDDDEGERSQLAGGQGHIGDQAEASSGGVQVAFHGTGFKSKGERQRTEVRKDKSHF